ncbi:MAG: galactokinase family protein, partial [Gemmatimonadales bacterium]
MTTWSERLAAVGLSSGAAELATRYFTEAAARYEALFGRADDALAWWVPGRIEVLGKHTDYGGGRSLVCAVERGFHVLAGPRDDDVVRIVDASTGAATVIPFRDDAEPRPGHWTDYPITVVRRLARDFPDAHRGMNAVIRSSLPSASGLSSSSALVIASFLPLAAFNALASTTTWARMIGDGDALAGYLGAVENGRAFGDLPGDRGVGTHGGSEDQTAILRSVPRQLLQYHFVPVTHEATIALPDGWQFVVAMSGVHAAKGGAVQVRYNALADDVATLLATWRDHTGRTDQSLFAALQSAPDAGDVLASVIAHAGYAVTTTLQPRLAQFRTETEVIIPDVARRLAAGDVWGLRDPVARSQALAETVLHNQIPETSHLAQSATDLGAAAASAFGAG